MNQQKTISPILFGSMLSMLVCFLFFSRSELFAAQIGCLFCAVNFVIWHRLSEALINAKSPGLEMLSFVLCKSLLILLAAAVVFLTTKFFIKKVLIGFFIAFFICLLFVSIGHRPAKI